MEENKTRRNTTTLVLFKNVRNTDKKHVGICDWETLVISNLLVV